MKSQVLNYHPLIGNSTRNDVCILSPILANLVTQVWVDDSKRFAGHNPLAFQLQLPTNEITLQTWRMPTSWVTLEPSADMIAQHYQPLYEPDGQLIAPWHDRDPMRTCAIDVEQAVHAALKQQHADHSEKNPL